MIGITVKHFGWASFGFSAGPYNFGIFMNFMVARGDWSIWFTQIL